MDLSLETEIVWVKEPSRVLDYLRVYSCPVDSRGDVQGRPTQLLDVEIVYGWANVNYVDAPQERRYFCLVPYDMGGPDYNGDMTVYPTNVFSVHSIQENQRPKTVHRPTPAFSNLGDERFSISSIPTSILESGDREFVFTEVIDHGGSIELLDNGETQARIVLGQEFSTLTVIRMSKTIPSFDLPQYISSYMTAINI